MTEKERIKSKREQILRELRKAGSEGVTNVKLSNVALRYGGCLGNLYRLGYVIEKKSEGNGVYRYTLISEPEIENKSIVSAYDKLMEAVENRGQITSLQLEQLIEDLGLAVRHRAGTFQSNLGELN